MFIRRHQEVYSITIKIVSFRDHPALDNNKYITNFLAKNNNNISFKFKQQIARQTGNGATKCIEILFLLKFLCKFLENS